MLTQNGPKILEYNVRFGDPETQVMPPLVEDDLIALLYASATNQSLPDSIKLSSDKCMTVVIASQGDPGLPERRPDFISAKLKNQTSFMLVLLSKKAKSIAMADVF